MNNTIIKKKIFIVHSKFKVDLCLNLFKSKCNTKYVPRFSTDVLLPNYILLFYSYHSIYVACKVATDPHVQKAGISWISIWRKQINFRVCWCISSLCICEYISVFSNGEINDDFCYPDFLFLM